MSKQRKKEIENIITKQRLLFCQEYIINDYNGTKAAKASGYSAKTAAQKAAELLRVPEIAEYIAILMEERNKRFEIDADWLLKKLVDIVEANLDDFIVKPEDGGLPYYDLSKATREQMAMLDGLQIETAYESQGEGAAPLEIRKIKLNLHNKMKAFEMIGKHINVQAFKERLEVTTEADLIDRITAGRKRLADK